MSKKITSIHELDLRPKSGKQYWTNYSRQWRGEFIYFLMADRFHANQSYQEPKKWLQMIKNNMQEVIPCFDSYRKYYEKRYAPEAEK